jgi:MFS family permease
MVQLGFVVGTAVAAVLNLADVIPARPYFAVSALVAALVNALLVMAPGYEAALVLRFLTGFFLAGVYPPAMKMIATWFQTGRGLAIGTIVGALTLGKATPYLTRALEGAHLLPVVLAASVGAVVAALLVGFAYADGPFPFTRRPFSWQLVGTVVRHRPTRLAIGGYLGHMWELYAVWTWVPAFLAASALAMQAGAPTQVLIDVAAFGAIGTGALGCVTVGQPLNGYQWELLPGGWLLFRRKLLAAGATCLDLGLLRGGRLCAVQRYGHRGGPFACGGNRAHAANLARLPAHDGHHPSGAGLGGTGWLALGVRGAGAGAGGGNHSHSAVPPGGHRCKSNSLRCHGWSELTFLSKLVNHLAEPGLTIYGVEDLVRLYIHDLTHRAAPTPLISYPEKNPTAGALRGVVLEKTCFTVHKSRHNSGMHCRSAWAPHFAEGTATHRQLACPAAFTAA